MSKKILVTSTDLMMVQFLLPHIRNLFENGYVVEVACSDVGGRMDEIHEKIMKALIQVYGEEEANKINEEWIGCSSEIELENEIVVFKEALYLGYDLADVFFNRR